MTELLIGTVGGLMSVSVDGGAASSSPRPVDGPPSVVFLARGADGVYALTRDGALWAQRGGDAWRPVNERPVPDEVWSLAADTRLPGRLYLGVAPALLYRSDNGGATWTACESMRDIPGYERWTFPPPPHIPHVRSIAPDPLAAGALYIGVEEGGVYHSPDGGETWMSLNEGLYWDVHTVTPTSEGGPLYATTGGGFYRSDDGGRGWRHITAGMDRGYTLPFAAARGRPGRIYTAAAAGPPPTWARGADAAIYRSEDRGDHWQRLTAGLPERLDTMVQALALDGADRVYAAAGGALFASDDAGDHWHAIAGALPTVRALLCQ